MAKIMKPVDVLENWGGLAKASMDAYFVFARELLVDSQNTLTGDEMKIRCTEVVQTIEIKNATDGSGERLPAGHIVKANQPTVAAKSASTRYEVVKIQAVDAKSNPVSGDVIVDVISQPGDVVLATQRRFKTR